MVAKSLCQRKTLVITHVTQRYVRVVPQERGPGRGGSGCLGN